MEHIYFLVFLAFAFPIAFRFCTALKTIELAAFLWFFRLTIFPFDLEFEAVVAVVVSVSIASATPSAATAGVDASVSMASASSFFSVVGSRISILSFLGLVFFSSGFQG